MDKIYSYWQGSEIGSAFAGTNTLPLHVVIGSQVPIALLVLHKRLNSKVKKH
nr:hypothetical protein [Mycoplasmopsis bovis]